MIHQIQCELHNLVDVKAGDYTSAPFLKKRGIRVGDFICFECNDAKFPSELRRWAYAEVIKTEQMSMVRRGARCDMYIHVTFQLVERLSDVTVG